MTFMFILFVVWIIFKLIISIIWSLCIDGFMRNHRKKRTEKNLASCLYPIKRSVAWDTSSFNRTPIWLGSINLDMSFVEWDTKIHILPWCWILDFVATIVSFNAPQRLCFLDQYCTPIKGLIKVLPNLT